VNEDSPDHPFEEFMISAGQYNALAAYATEMEYHRQSDSERTALSKRPEFDDEVMNYEFLRQFSAFHCIQLFVSRKRILPTKSSPFPVGQQHPKKLYAQHLLWAWTRRSMSKYHQRNTKLSNPYMSPSA